MKKNILFRRRRHVHRAARRPVRCTAFHGRVRGLPALVLPAALLVSLAGCAGAAGAAATAPAQPMPPVSHIHGITVDPTSSTVLLATHEGLYNATATPAVEVGDGIDLMGFTATGNRNVFYASGHPAEGSALPNPAGLIRSGDGGKTWTSVSRQGRSDFHALTVTAGGLVGFDGNLLTSRDGKEWTPSAAAFTPAVLAGSAAGSVVLATSQDGLQRSTDGGKTWKPNPAAPLMQFAAFAAGDRTATEAVGASPNGTVYVSADAGLSWRQTGRVSGQIEALTAVEGSGATAWIWAATTSGVQVSTDGGVTFRPAEAQ